MQEITIERYRAMDAALRETEHAVERMFDRWREGEEGLNYWSIYDLQHHTRQCRASLDVMKRGINTHYGKALV